MEPQWHYFIAHESNVQNDLAIELYYRLGKTARVFLDIKTLTTGEDRETVLAAVQNASLITLVMITPCTDSSYYRRKEIAAAIDLAGRKDGRRVIPIFVCLESTELLDNVPSGLRLEPSITITAATDLDAVVTELDEARNGLVISEIIEPEIVTRQFKHDVQCPMCTQNEVDRNESISIKEYKGLDSGWAVGGNIKLSYCAHNKCRNCGNVFEDIERIIPFKHGLLKCPSCGTSENLKVRIKQLNKIEQDFTFQAVLKCSRCHRIKRLQKALKALWSVAVVLISKGRVSVLSTNSS